MEGIISKKVDKWPLNIILFCFFREDRKNHTNHNKTIQQFTIITEENYLSEIYYNFGKTSKLFHS